MYPELEAMLLSVNWQLVAKYFENKVKQEIVDLVQGSDSLTLESLRKSQATIEAYKEFINLPSTIVSLNEQHKKSSADVKRR